MKNSLGLFTSFMLALQVHGQRRTVRDFPGFKALRNLGNLDYVFLENNSFTPFCITKTGTNSIGFRECDYANEPSNQLWRFDSDGKVHSKEDESKCWIVNDGNTVGDGEITLVDCDSTGDSVLAKFDTDLTQFEDQIRVDTPASGDEPLCVTSDSDSFDSLETEPIFVSECGISDRFLWISTFATGGLSFEAYTTGSGCIMPRDQSTYSGNALVYGSCDLNNLPEIALWYQDEDGLVHARQDLNLCWQAGHGGSLGDGSKMRLKPCDNTSDLQKFDPETAPWGLVSRPDLCIVFRGVNINLDKDPIIFKECDRISSGRINQWTNVSGDY